MGYEAKKTEHAGCKKGTGAYWGRKAAAKKQGNRKRREHDKLLTRNELPCGKTAPLNKNALLT